jgi:hypothetical protein
MKDSHRLARGQLRPESLKRAGGRNPSCRTLSTQTCLRFASLRIGRPVHPRTPPSARGSLRGLDCRKLSTSAVKPLRESTLRQKLPYASPRASAGSIVSSIRLRNQSAPRARVTLVSVPLTISEVNRYRDGMYSDSRPTSEKTCRRTDSRGLAGDGRIRMR